MAIAFDSFSQGDIGTSATHTQSHTCSGSNRYLLVAVNTYHASVPAYASGVTYNGVEMQLITQASDGSRTNLWGLVAPATGAHNIVATVPSTQDEIVVTSMSFTGVHQTTPRSNGVAGTSATTSNSRDIAVYAGDMVCDAIAWYNQAITVGANQTNRVEENNGAGFDSLAMSTEGPVGAAGTVTMSWSWAADEGSRHTVVALHDTDFVLPAGTLIQHSAFVATDSTSVTIDGSTGQPTTWSTPTSGNTIVAAIISRRTIASFTAGFTQVASNEVGDYTTYVYAKVSAGTETSIAATFNSTVETQMMAVWEFAGELTFDQMAHVEALATTTVGATTGTLASATSTAIAFAHHWAVSDTAFDNSFVRDSHYDGGSNGTLFYVGAAHKALSSTSAVTVNASWTGSSDASITLAVFSLETTPQTSATLNTGGGISATVVKRINQIVRPTSTVSAGTWDTGPTAGQSLHGYTSDDSDTTYIYDPVA